MQPAAPQQLEGEHRQQIEHGHHHGHEQAHRAQVLRPAKLLRIGHAQQHEVAAVHGLDGHGALAIVLDDPGHGQHIEAEQEENGQSSEQHELAAVHAGEIGVAHVVEEGKEQEGSEQKGVQFRQILRFQHLHPPQHSPGAQVKIQGKEGQKGVFQQFHGLLLFRRLWRHMQ